MGLVTCEKCKKIYDYDKYNGICPKCARYNRENSSAQEHQDYHNKYDGGYNHTEQDDHHSYHQKYDDITNPHADLFETEPKKAKIDLKSKKVLGIFLILMIFMFLIPFFGPVLFIVAVGAIVSLAKNGKLKK